MCACWVPEWCGSMVMGCSIMAWTRHYDVLPPLVIALVCLALMWMAREWRCCMWFGQADCTCTVKLPLDGTVHGPLAPPQTRHSCAFGSGQGCRLSLHASGARGSGMLYAGDEMLAAKVTRVVQCAWSSLAVPSPMPPHAAATPSAADLEFTWRATAVQRGVQECRLA